MHNQGRENRNQRGCVQKRLGAMMTSITVVPVYVYIDIRDDRVYTYFSLNPNSRKTFVVQLSAAYRGRFYLPAFSCEAMYDASVTANSEGKWVEVE